MRCREIMKSDVECVEPRATVQDAARRMRDEEIGFLPVCDDSMKVLGTVTDRDLTIRVLAVIGFLETVWPAFVRVSVIDFH